MEGPKKKSHITKEAGKGWLKAGVAGVVQGCEAGGAPAV